MLGMSVRHANMSCKVSACLLFSITLFCSMVLMQISVGNALVPEEERALEILRERFDLPVWTGDPCSTVQWITCSSSSVVSQLNLQQRNLVGTIPAEIGEFRSTVELILSVNRLSGPLPDLLNMTVLESLELEENNLTGGIPPAIVNHGSLSMLNLSYNPLGGPIPAITGASGLTTIDLTQTQVTGSILDSFKNLRQLVNLYLGNNPQLNGSVSFLDQLYNLKSFNGSHCGFSGGLPTIQNSGGLELLDLQMNDFSGVIPDVLFAHQSLRTLYLNNNPKLSGGIPVMDLLKGLVDFMIHDCDFSGPLHDGVFAYNLQLEVIGIWNNRFTSFPTDLQALVNLREIDVHSNDIIGGLPELPSAANQTANRVLTRLTFSNNQFNGEIPSSWYKLTNLQGMNLSRNRLSGQLPEQLGDLINLETLDLSNNQFTGNVPGTIALLPKLKLLLLDNNGFTGIPRSLLDREDIKKSYANNPGIRILESNKKSGVPAGIIVGAIIGTCAIIGVLITVFIFYSRKSKRKGGDEISQADMPPSVQSFTRKQIKELTENYKTSVGKGGFGSVYYGKLADGREVAVKVRKADSKQGSAEFLNEVRLLSRLHHRNLVSLVGYCLEANQRMLVYDFMSQGTLEDHLYSKVPVSRDQSTNPEDSSRRKRLPWKTRLSIAIYAAKGLEYLHHDCNPPVIHRDVKSSNILLTRKLIAKVGDLGISKQASDKKDSDEEFNKSGVSTVIKGTFGYMDPEYFTRRRLTTKSDVYSFGMVLLEIITGKRPLTQKFPDSGAGNLREWVRNAVNADQLELVTDPELHGQYDKEVMLKVVQLALSCTHFSSLERPDMREVARSLTQALHMEGDYLDDSGISSALSKTREIVSTSREEEILEARSAHASSSSFSSTAFSYPSRSTETTGIVASQT
ncbi:hypothetical protein R1flu_011890 [Riccia fluitans]|uniref:Protein kinase domain-containing protein n=1 Tax=Riccia fluitans TaxID=41844 RepID=A0ABD1Z9B0_9MARC